MLRRSSFMAHAALERLICARDRWNPLLKDGTGVQGFVMAPTLRACHEPGPVGIERPHPRRRGLERRPCVVPMVLFNRNFRPLNPQQVERGNLTAKTCRQGACLHDECVVTGDLVPRAGVADVAQMEMA